MKLRDYTLDQLANFVVGDHPHFIYRSSSYITRFFGRCDLPFTHDGSSRRSWACGRLKELNEVASTSTAFPEDSILTVINELFDPDDFADLSRETALESLNKVLNREGLEAYFPSFLAEGFCKVRTSTGAMPGAPIRSPRPLSAEELEQRQKVESFLDTASEDEFTQKLLVPLFQRLGFHRVSAAGHTEKTLEYGKDLWMKYQLPTSHWIYFGAQIKKDKLDMRGDNPSSNLTTVLTQVRMAVDHPIFDPDAGRKILIDHMFVISAGEITRSAQNWLAQTLDQTQRRQLIFMDPYVSV